LQSSKIRLYRSAEGDKQTLFIKKKEPRSMTGIQSFCETPYRKIIKVYRLDGMFIVLVEYN